MKKRTVLLLVAAALVCAGVLGVYRFLGSPLYALKEIGEDVQTSGLAGLRPHLTAEAQETVDVAAMLEEKLGLGSAALALLGPDRAAQLLQEVEWSLKGVQREGDQAVAAIAFSFPSLLSGELALDMVRQGGEWKIQGVSLSELSGRFSS